MSLPTWEFYSLKHAYTIATKEGRNSAIVDFPGFFLKTEGNKDDESITTKVIGTVILLLAEWNLVK